MGNYITYLLNPGQYADLSKKMSAKFVLVLYLINAFLSLAVQAVTSIVSPTAEYELLAGSLGVAGFVVMVTCFSFLLGLGITVVMYAFLTAFTQVLITSGADKPTFKGVARIYIFSFLPSVILGIITSLITIVFVPFLGVEAVMLLYSIITIALVCVAIVAFLWTIYLLVASIQSRYKTTAGNAIVAGCLPTIFVYLCMFTLIITAALAFAGLVASTYRY